MHVDDDRKLMSRVN